MHVYSNPDLKKFTALPARLQAQWAMAWLDSDIFYADLCALFPEREDRLALLILMDHALSLIIAEGEPS